jgi:hypothetical protein
MRLVWFLPVTFVAGIDGFELFVPYLIVVMAIAVACRQLKRISRRSAGLALARVAADGFSELEAAAA